MYSQDLIDAVLKAADIVDVISAYLSVEKHGRNYVAVCPFHDDKNPSLQISKDKQIFKCFACGAGGNAITFVQRYDKLSFNEAVRKVADIVNFSDPRLIDNAPKVQIDPAKERLYNCINDLQTFYKYALSIDESQIARDYLKTRNIDAAQQKKYGIGYAPNDGALTIQYLTTRGHSLKSIEDIGIAASKGEAVVDVNAGRLIFPIADHNGQVIGFSARRLDGIHDKKYVNSKEGPIFHKGNVLYNYHNVVSSAKHDGYCYILEGFMDVMALERAGIQSAVALMGTALTQDHVELLKKLRCELRICLDGDTAGQDGMIRMIPLLLKNGISFRFVDYGKDLRDPDDILQQEGKEALKAKMETLIEPLDFQLNYFTNTKRVETSVEKQKLIEQFLPTIRSLPFGIEQENYLAKLSKATGYEIEAIRNLLNKEPAPTLTREEAIYRDAVKKRSLNHPEKKALSRLVRAERTILYYMMYEKEAVEFFKSSIGDFHTDLYEAIAMYILDYEKDHPGTIVDISSITAAMQSNDDENSMVLVDATSQLAMSKDFPAYDRKTLDTCLKVIAEEAESKREKEKTKEAIRQSDDPNAAAKAIAEFAKRKKNLGEWPKKNKK